MYGGEEVSAIVVDLGSHTCKAGYAGEDAPKAVFPSVVGAIDGNGMDIDDAANTTEDAKESDKEKGKRKLYTGSQALNFRRDQMEILSPTKDGIVTDWDMLDNVWIMLLGTDYSGGTSSMQQLKERLEKDLVEESPQSA
ncbi:unnamed protein product [Arabidopsis thaliana]|uniref:Actin-related protein 4A n=1 Tax=Arabidopsis thaliana TaxID=3702 RepID=A0A5S9WU57_ARATH|nr:unnamed protein product [Arabidopsis thaliana]